MRKRFFHRGYTVSLFDVKKELYRTKIAGKILIGSYFGIKQSIDWWTDTRILRQPSEFEKQDFSKPDAHKKTESYRGVQLINDEGDEASWYTYFRGQLIKGTLSSLKQFIDKHTQAN